MRILAFAASLRSASLNHKLIQLAARLAAREGAEVDVVRFREFDMPLYDGDEDAAHGLPEGARKLQRRVEGAAAPFERLFRDLRGFVRFAEAIEPLCCAPPPVGDATQRAAEIAAALESETELQPET